jgi:hypothetical protein
MPGRHIIYESEDLTPTAIVIERPDMIDLCRTSFPFSDSDISEQEEDSGMADCLQT